MYASTSFKASEMERPEAFGLRSQSAEMIVQILGVAHVRIKLIALAASGMMNQRNLLV